MSKHQITGNVGLYYVCYRLSRLGWNVMPTSRNARGIDVVAYNEDGTCYIGIQVKTMSKKIPVPLGDSLAKIRGDYWVIVANAASEPECYVMEPSEVKERAHRGEKDGRVSFWLQPAAYALDVYRERWGRVEAGFAGRFSPVAVSDD